MVSQRKILAKSWFSMPSLPNVSAVWLGYTFAQSVIFPKDSLPILLNDEIEETILAAAIENFDSDTAGNKHSELMKEALKWYIPLN